MKKILVFYFAYYQGLRITVIPYIQYYKADFKEFSWVQGTQD